MAHAHTQHTFRFTRRALAESVAGGRADPLGRLSGRARGWRESAGDFRAQGVIRPASIGSRASFEAMNRALALHGLHPIVDQVRPWQEAREAFRAMEAGTVFGKVALAF
ncbi:zinc-binding dehydrogenase [Ralstonia condita]|uniref:zinc-binding dehydrogenase n=1 Tax=Ralstonia condita TaxID=3058600 RepID=UPI0029312F24|nr:zinc-binding dehydrogenase [Ralstonia sp. LMG 7141]